MPACALCRFVNLVLIAFDGIKMCFIWISQLLSNNVFAENDMSVVDFLNYVALLTLLGLLLCEVIMKFGVTLQKLIAQVYLSWNFLAVIGPCSTGVEFTTFYISERTKIVTCLHALYRGIWYCRSCAASVCEMVVLLDANSPTLFSYNCWFIV